VLFLITARGGSKGIPGKNLLALGGVSLIGYKAISAKRCDDCARLILSSEDPAIQAEARKFGVDVPFTRPAELATDEATTEAVIWHAMQQIETQTQETYDAIMVLEPTSPFATHHDYAAAIRLMERTNASTVVGVREVAVRSLFQGPMDVQGRMPEVVTRLAIHAQLARQAFAPEFTMNGAFYLLRWESFRMSRKRYHDPASTYGLVMERERSIEIDEPVDWAFAQFLVERGYVDISYWTNEEAVVR